ncbi:hypothetical protein Hanom_Chr00s000003g01604771 [Helianthus anomalus]
MAIKQRKEPNIHIIKASATKSQLLLLNSLKLFCQLCDYGTNTLQVKYVLVQ